MSSDLLAAIRNRDKIQLKKASERVLSEAPPPSAAAAPSAPTNPMMNMMNLAAMAAQKAAARRAKQEAK
jgi:hypothetical protein